MEGEFVVHSLSEAPEDKKREVIDGVRYPEQDLPGVVVTELEIWEVDTNIGGVLTWSYWRSFFNRRPDYNILLKQTDLNGDGSDVTQVFVLYETADVESSQHAFEQIRDVIEPLVDDCNVMMTEELLEELLLPTPCSADRLVFQLVQIMGKNEEAHPDWVKVLQAVSKPALANDDGESIQFLLDQGLVKPEHANNAGDTLLHHAATSGTGKGIKQVIDSAGAKMSAEEKQQLLNRTNKEGKTSLHVAFEKNNQDAVRELMSAGASLTTGGEGESNPLHLAAECDSARSISSAYNKKNGFIFSETADNPDHIRFVDALNTRNKRGFTPVMVSVRQKYLESAMSLLSAGADPNIAHPETGDTALHYAADLGYVKMVKALIIFFADVKATNKEGKTALDVARDSSAEKRDKCVRTLEEVTNLLDEVVSKISDQFHPSRVSQDTTFLLSIDGGGSRSLISCHTLITLHKRMKQLQPNCGPLGAYFDYVAGTSGGAILGLGLTHANTSPELCRSLCYKFAEDVCGGTPTFPPETMNACLKESYGDELSFASSEKPRAIIMAVRNDRNPTELHLFRNYGDQKETEMKVWEVARCSSAAPVYFTAYEDKYVDGGVMANNPTLDAMAEIIDQGDREKENVKFGLVVSIGTGKAPSSEVESNDIHVPKLSDILGSISSAYETVSGFVNLLNTFISQSTQTDGQEVTRARAWCRSIDAPYFRLSPSLSRPYDLSESRKGKLTQLMFEAHLYLLRNAEQVDAVAKILLSRGMR